MDNVTEEKLASETKPLATATASPAAPINKLAANRMANKQRKKKAHRRTLRRSHTKG
ncbi:MAG: hypothetical protein WCC04_01610 [Terriglobales bacterium]